MSAKVKRCKPCVKAAYAPIARGLGIAHFRIVQTVGQSPKEAAMTRSKLSTKAVLLAGAIGLSTAVFAGSQPADAQYFPTGTVDDAGYGPTTGGVGYYGYYYGDPNGAYGTVRRWGAPVYDHGSVHGFGHRMGRAVGVDRGFSAAHYGNSGFGL